MFMSVIVQVSGVSAGRFDIDAVARKESFELAKMYCGRALEVDPEDGTANMNVRYVCVSHHASRS